MCGNTREMCLPEECSFLLGDIIAAAAACMPLAGLHAATAGDDQMQPKTVLL